MKASILPILLHCTLFFSYGQHHNDTAQPFDDDMNLIFEDFELIIKNFTLPDLLSSQYHREKGENDTINPYMLYDSEDNTPIGLTTDEDTLILHDNIDHGNIFSANTLIITPKNEELNFKIHYYFDASFVYIDTTNNYELIEIPFSTKNQELTNKNNQFQLPYVYPIKPPLEFISTHNLNDTIVNTSGDCGTIIHYHKNKQLLISVRRATILRIETFRHGKLTKSNFLKVYHEDPCY